MSWVRLPAIFIRNCQQSVPVKELLKSINIWRRCDKSLVTGFYGPRCVCVWTVKVSSWCWSYVALSVRSLSVSRLPAYFSCSQRSLIMCPVLRSVVFASIRHSARRLQLQLVVNQWVKTHLCSAMCHVLCVLKSLMIVPSQIVRRACQWKNIENWSVVGKDMDKCLLHMLMAYSKISTIDHRDGIFLQQFEELACFIGAYNWVTEINYR